VEQQCTVIDSYRLWATQTTTNNYRKALYVLIQKNEITVPVA